MAADFGREQGWPIPGQDEEASYSQADACSQSERRPFSQSDDGSSLEGSSEVDEESGSLDLQGKDAVLAASSTFKQSRQPQRSTALAAAAAAVGAEMAAAERKLWSADPCWTGIPTTPSKKKKKRSTKQMVPELKAVPD